MTAADEYRRMAEASLRFAREAKTEEEQSAFLKMAATWSERAAQEDAPLGRDVRSETLIAAHAATSRLPRAAAMLGETTSLRGRLATRPSRYGRRGREGDHF
jgi:hypothetical protein